MSQLTDFFRRVKRSKPLVIVGDIAADAARQKVTELTNRALGGSVAKLVRLSDAEALAQKMVMSLTAIHQALELGQITVAAAKIAEMQKALEEAVTQ
jgi:diphthamide synthase (EF-2-diphthine--ammonia ligase)